MITCKGLAEFLAHGKGAINVGKVTLQKIVGTLGCRHNREASPSKYGAEELGVKCKDQVRAPECRLESVGGWWWDVTRWNGQQWGPSMAQPWERGGRQHSESAGSGRLIPVPTSHH